jgi:type IV secretory pathway VirJ component
MKNSVKVLLVLFLFLSTKGGAQNLPVDTLNSNDSNKPLIFYLTGDGGMNSFSKSFIKQWNRHGYPIIALNLKSYLWNAKTPDKAAADVTGLLRKYMHNWKRQRLVLVGYSLGADVLPFVQTRLEDDVKDKSSNLVLLSPSATTDFEVHVFYSSKGASVPAEINKLTKPTLIIFGNAEKDVPEKSISNKNVTIIKVPGDHHYNDDVAYLVQQISNRL